MIAVLMFLNSRGDVVLSRPFREGYSVRALADTFRNELISTKKADRSPVNILDKLCYVHLKLTDLYVVMVSSGNMNITLSIQYAIRVLQVMNEYLEALDEAAIKEHFIALQGIIDESMDFGYPQLTDAASLQEFIDIDGFLVDTMRRPEDAERVTRKIMGDVPWRADGLIYSVNEVFVDIFEDVNLLMSPTGDILQSSVLGRVVLKNFLSGMPECELLLNTRAYGEAPLVSPTSGDAPAPLPLDDVHLSDVSFHTCVRLNDFNAPQRIKFVPPDGEFTLMSYRSQVDVQPPLKVVAAQVRELSKTRIEIEFNLKVDVEAHHTATGIEVRVPCPENTATVKVKVGKGKAKFDPIAGAIVWKISSATGGQEILFVAEIKQIAPTLDADQTLWSRPPISVAFQIITHSLTGLRVSEMKVEEPVLMYTPNKWIRYTTGGGQYQCRI